MKSKICLSLFVLLISCVSVFGQPKLPYKDFGGEPCKFCQYGEWIAKSATTIFKTMEEKSTVAFYVESGEKVSAITGVVIATKAGIGKALRNTYLEKYDEKKDSFIKFEIKKDEKFYLLTYQGEDVYKVWFKGRILSAHFLDKNLHKISSPESIWWVKIKNSTGQIGWTNETRNFDGEPPY